MESWLTPDPASDAPRLITMGASSGAAAAVAVVPNVGGLVQAPPGAQRLTSANGLSGGPDEGVVVARLWPAR